MSGIMGKILRVDLSSGKIWDQDIPKEYVKDYIGSDGIAARIIYDEVPPEVDPLSPDNRLIVHTGPLTGTPVPSACRHGVSAKSPVTGRTMYHSHASSFFSSALRRSGYDAIVFQGKAAKPVYLWINDGTVEIRDAKRLWGHETFETDELIKKELGESRLGCITIGPAGENLVLYASVVNDKGHVCARGGMGAVMGSKNLKAVAAYGTKAVPMADEKKARELARQWRKINDACPTVTNMLSPHGTAAGTAIFYGFGDFPIKNWSSGKLYGIDRLTGPWMVGNWLVKHTTCPGCTIRHNKLLRIKDGPFAGKEVELPEFEMTSATGANIGVTDPGACAYGNDLLDRLGLDGLGTSNVMGWAMECYEKGLITKKDTGGIELTWGNYEAFFQMVEKMVKREGFGDILARGTVKAAEHVGKGSDKFVVHIKNMPLPMHDYRAFWGVALGYLVGTAGCAHEGGPIEAEMAGLVDRFSIEGKAPLVQAGQEWWCLLNHIGVCAFAGYGVSAELMADTLSAVTGVTFTVEDTHDVIRRTVNLRRAYDIKNGITPADDNWSPRMQEPAPADGPIAGRQPPVKEMVLDYYNFVGWDKETGKPYKETLEKFGLNKESKELWG